MSSKGLEMLRKHLSYYDFDPDKVVLLGNVLYYAKKAEFEFAGLEAENAKLRELVRNLWRVIPADVTGVVIGANTDHPTYYKFDEAFRELGIEVDE